MVEGKDSRYNLFCIGNDKGMGSARILMAKKWVEAISDVTHVSDKIILITLAAGKSIVMVLSVYAPQAGLDDSVKDLFCENLQWTLTKISASEILFFCGDLNGQIADEYKCLQERMERERIEMGMRKFMVVEDLEDIIWGVREFLNLLSLTT